MLAQLLEILGSAVVSFISETGYVGIAILMAIESACIPLPSEIVMPFAGYLVSTGDLNLFAVGLAGAIGCYIGSPIAFFIGAWGGRPFIERWGRYVLLNPHDIDVAERFFARFGVLAVFIGRLLPVVRTFIALPAGFGRMNMLKFQVYSFIGSLIWCLLLAWVGKLLGTQWASNPDLHAAFRSADVAIVVIAVALAGLYIWRRWKRV